MLLLRISNFYNAFYFDDFKVTEWLNLLSHIPYDQASANLEAYTLNIQNQYPPHPGILAATAIQQSTGQAVLDAAETRLMLEGRMVEEKDFVGMPEHVKEAARQIARESTDTGVPSITSKP
ncbi:hypothetical protein [Paenibacillus sp. IITD108]|uniref:hypothetical protein n=1 Tax=Paenibacillus sp. IITD108 TaxID=3116649 RepID=UPI002F42278A